MLLAMNIIRIAKENSNPNFEQQSCKALQFDATPQYISVFNDCLENEQRKQFVQVEHRSFISISAKRDRLCDLKFPAY